jgi:Asp-tRNA(Asn)/Glu-tRNA(Gln) amidotransferase C subunit
MIPSRDELRRTAVLAGLDPELLAADELEDLLHHAGRMLAQMATLQALELDPDLPPTLWPRIAGPTALRDDDDPDHDDTCPREAVLDRAPGQAEGWWCVPPAFDPAAAEDA